MRKLKRLWQVLWLDWETERKVEQYRDDFFIYWYDLDGENSKLGDRVPFYTVMENYARKMFCFMTLFGAICAILSIPVRGEGGLGRFVCLMSAIACAVVAFLAWHPGNYWGYKRRFGKVRVLRFFTNKAMTQFEADRKVLEDIVRDYKEERAKKEAAEMTENTLRQQAEREAEARRKAEFKAKFLPQFMVLLEYVRRNFGITTPSPEHIDGKFAILLPCTDSEELEEYAFDYELKEVERLIVIISNMDTTMRKRAELRALVNSEFCDYPRTHSMQASTRNDY